MFEIEVDSEKAHDFLTDLERRQMPWALALASTRLGQRVQKGALTVMRSRLDRPKKTTENSLLFKAATKNGAQALVYFRGADVKQWTGEYTSGIPADTYLQQAVHGGRRRHKRFEEALIARWIMRRNEYAIPAEWVRDSFGNVPRGLLMKVLSGIGAAEMKEGLMANATGSRRSRRKGNAQRFFAGTVDGVRGIWERRGTAWGEGVRPVFIFTTDTPGYRVIFPFFKIAANIVKAHHADEVRKALAEAVRTAR